MLAQKRGGALKLSPSLSLRSFLVKPLGESTYYLTAKCEKQALYTFNKPDTGPVFAIAPNVLQQFYLALAKRLFSRKRCLNMYYLTKGIPFVFLVRWVAT